MNMAETKATFFIEGILPFFKHINLTVHPTFYEYCKQFWKLIFYETFNMNIHDPFKDLRHVKKKTLTDLWTSAAFKLSRKQPFLKVNNFRGADNCRF